MSRAERSSREVGGRPGGLLTAGGLLAAAAALAACAPQAEAPRAPVPSLAAVFGAALEEEAQSSALAGPYLDAIDRAAADVRADGALATIVASCDALVGGAAPGVDAPDSGIAYRSSEMLAEVVLRLTRAWSAADAAGLDAPALPFVRGTLAAALHRIALRVGDEGAAGLWGTRRGCAQEAAILGPIDWTPLRGLEGPSPVETVGKPMQRTYPGVAPFAAKIAPAAVRADMCELNVDATSFLQGTRAVVLDLANPVAQRVSLALTSSSAAVVEIGGVAALRRGYEEGGRPVTRFASVDAEPGLLRVVVRVAQKSDGGSLELDAWGEDGQPIRARAPKPGDVAPARASKPAQVDLSPRKGASHGELALGAAALLGLGEARRAEHLLEAYDRRAEEAALAASTRAPGAAPASGAAPAPASGAAPAPASGAAPAPVSASVSAPVSAPASAPAPVSSPRLDLLYARAVALADDLPDTKVVERLRRVSERLGAAWPRSWEARLLAAQLAERRRGAGEGVIDALKALGVDAPAQGGRAGSPSVPDADRIVLSQIASIARRASMPDVAEAAYAKLAAIAAGSVLLANVDARLHGRVGADAVKAACEGGADRSSTACLEALHDRGGLEPMLAEIARLRRLRRAPDALREVELSERVAHGDLEGALAVYDALPPADRRMLEALGLAAGRGNLRAVRTRLARDRILARDAPYAIAPLVRALGLLPDPAPPLEAAGRKLVLEDQKTPVLPGAATAVLRHIERYDIAADGLVRYVTYDLRRVSGTTDVAQGAIAYGPMIEGRGTPRLLRRRIHKRDGRVLSPDAAQFAAQAANDLSQLEQGDYVEQITEGYALPSDTGQLVIDTSDLLPERTSVHEAEIEVRRPAAIPFALWSHPLLGKPAQRAEGPVSVMVWRLKDQPPRRLEDGVPSMEQGVRISLGTQTWANVAAAIDENIRSLQDRDPYVALWATTASAPAEGALDPAGRSGPRALVERIVAAAGKKVKVAGGAELSDVAAIFGGGAQRTTARTILELGQGSRSWIIYRALNELGVKADLAIAETEPFSAAPDFPAHVGRFRHPLVIARLGWADGDLWIDADVEGPPLPPGRISPELRGRAAMLPSGEIVTVQAAGGETGDEVDVRLAVDPQGNAKGTFTILLHGRPAQALSEAFETVVGTDRREMLRNVVMGWVPWADVEDVAVSSTEGSWEVALRAQIAIHGFARPEGKGGRTWTIPGLEPVHVGFPRSFAGTLGETYASRGARQSALSIETALQYHVRRRIELPPGARVARAPGAVRVEDARIQASRKGSYAQVIEEDFVLSLPTGTVAAGEYGGFVDRVQAIDSGFMAGIRVDAPAAAEPPAARPKGKGAP
ncbi:MAG: hypothetical protein IT372_13250 [Polyangiaceae bacterium]|nr:hypothetical protein [Polyangiaceae bacterium]